MEDCEGQPLMAGDDVEVTYDYGGIKKGRTGCVRAIEGHGFVRCVGDGVWSVPSGLLRRLGGTCVTGDSPAAENPLLRVVLAAQAYRRDNEGWDELCAALDALAVTGAVTEIEKLGRTPHG